MAKDLGGMKMDYVIEGSFEYQGIHYGPGEEVPEGMTSTLKEEFFRRGRLAKVEGGKVIRFQREIELNDEQIGMLLTQPLAIIEATLKSGSFSEKTIGKISMGAIQRNLPQVSKFLKDKLKPKNILQSAEKVEAKESEEKPKEEFKCSCGKEFESARKLQGHRMGTGHKK